MSELFRDSDRYWNQTYTGQAFNLLCPDPDSVDIRDIATSLANLCRYNGHSLKFYSVAEHSLLASRAVPFEYALEALLHDAAEAYVGDMVRPLKSLPPDYRQVEARVQLAVRARFGLPAEMSAAVAEADARMLATELEFLMSHPPKPWGLMVDPYELSEIGLPHVRSFGLPPREAHRRFLERFAQLKA